MPAKSSADRDAIRFLAKVNKTDQCWLWTAATKSNGYGVFFMGRRLTGAHRASWRLHNGPIPRGLFVLHRCDVRNCVNPAHLFLGTQKQNGEDMASKERSHKTKLTARDVIEIRRRRADGETLTALGAEYGVTFATIGHIANRVTWRHLPA